MSNLMPTLPLPQRLYRRSRAALRWLAQPAIITRRRAAWKAHGEKWAVSMFEASGSEIVFGGWAITPPESRGDLEFTVNGQPATAAQYPMPRPDVAAAYPLVPDANESGFRCRHRLAQPLPPGDSVEITCINRVTGKPFGRDYYPYFCRTPHPADPPIPESTRRVRVIGQDDNDYFQTSGYRQYRLLEWAMQQATGKTLADCQHILDWGCGCGRVSRYFRDRPAGSFTGGDVDADNVAWCKANLAGSFETLPLHPPTGFANGLFDMIFGISVFTHLLEPVQNAWLDELHRLTRPGAVLLLTFHGDATLYRHSENFTQEQKLTRQRNGILDLVNQIYDATLAEENYYRETYHTESYIRKHWGKRFDIVDILPGIIGPQDLVVARRK